MQEREAKYDEMKRHEMATCQECGREMSFHELETNHFHAVQTVSSDPLVLLLDLPDGCTPGRWEAADAFAEAVGELKQKYPTRTFHYIPFAHDNFGSLRAMLAVAE